MERLTEKEVNGLRERVQGETLRGVPGDRQADERRAALRHEAAAARGRAGAPPSHACAGCAPRAWPSSAAGGGLERGLPHVPGRDERVPSARPQRMVPVVREPAASRCTWARSWPWWARPGSGKTLLADAILGLYEPNATVCGTHLVRRRTSGRRIPRGPARPRHLARAAEREQPGPAHEGGSAGARGSRARTCPLADARTASAARAVRALRLGPKMRRAATRTSFRAAWRAACFCAARSWTTRALIMADEPTPGLGPGRSRCAALADFRGLRGRGRAACMLITHDIELALRVADRVAVFQRRRRWWRRRRLRASRRRTRWRHPFSRDAVACAARARLRGSVSFPAGCARRRGGRPPCLRRAASPMRYPGAREPLYRDFALGRGARRTRGT